jgi:phage tail tape-measure protein
MCAAKETHLSGEDESRNGTPSRAPISKAPGTHPVGTGLGAVLGGAAAGAATGTMAGPVGTIAGAAVGAVLGGLAGKSVAEAIDPTLEAAYWRSNSQVGRMWTAGPPSTIAVRLMVTGSNRSADIRDASSMTSSQICREAGAADGTSNLSWDHAKHAVRDAWNRASASD